MDIASATSGRAGSYRRLADGLRAFQPKPLPPDPPLDMDEPLQALLSGADQSLGRLDGAVRILPDSDLFVFMFMRREAVLSSQIEGTQSSLDDVLRAEAGILDPDRPRDVGEVLGYIAALRHGTRTIAQGRGMSVELMLALHDRLMSGARGGSLHPGRLRDDIVSPWRPVDGLKFVVLIFAHRLPFSFPIGVRFIVKPPPTRRAGSVARVTGGEGCRPRRHHSPRSVMGPLGASRGRVERLQECDRAG